MNSININTFKYGTFVAINQEQAVVSTKNLCMVALIALSSSGVFANGYSTCVSGANTRNCYVPEGITSMNLSITGGGGGGGGGGPALGGGGGAGGGNCKITALSVSPGQLLIINVGAAGQGGTAASSGTSGGSSSVTYNSVTYSGDGGEGGNTSGAGGQGAALTSCAGGTTNPGGDGMSGTNSQGGVGGFGGDAPPPGAYGGAGGAPNSGGANGAVGSVVLSFPVAEPASIPTLGEWAVLLMAGLMALFGIHKMRRRH